MKIKTSEIIGPPLDWAVAQAQGIAVKFCGRIYFDVPGARPFRPSTDPSQGHPIIERENISVIAHRWIIDPQTLDFKPGKYWRATNGDGVEEESQNFLGPSAFDGEGKRRPGYGDEDGPTALVAAMRCVVAMRWGKYVDVPEELL